MKRKRPVNNSIIYYIDCCLSVMRFIGLHLLLVLLAVNSGAQDFILTGQVTDNETGIPLTGVNILISETYIGTVSDAEGNYRLQSSKQPPFLLRVSMIGYDTREIEVSGSERILDIQLTETAVLGQDVVVSASRMEESLLQTPVSIEKLGITDLQKTTAANFYDGLYNLKGVDMNVQSLTFRVPNTRGFNGNTNYRFNQFIDGVDNTPAGLGFSAGNIFGLSQLDVESVEILVGASSALYGQGGMNGTLLMTSKNPFEYQGLQASLQMGMMNFGAKDGDGPTPMTDFNLRYAKSFNDKIAFKVVFGYLRATDWQATDYRDRNALDNPASTRESNEGYDGVNIYGDEIIVPVNLSDLAPEVAGGLAENIAGLSPGSPEYDIYVDSVAALFPDQVISRNGWKEQDLVDYETKNLRVQGSLNYRFSEKYEMILAGGYSTGVAVYTAQNRFSLIDFSTYMTRFEIRSPEGFIRFWKTGENAGDTYDAGTTGTLINEAWKSSEEWYEDYVGAFAQSYIILGFPLDQAYGFARSVANNRQANGAILNPGLPAFPYAGTSEFNALKNQITDEVIPGGTRVVEKTSMSNFEAMYNLKELISFAEIIVGAQYRRYSINSEGTTFVDEPGNPVNTWWWAAYAQAGKSALKERMKVTISARYDKHQQFDGIFTPRFSMVYSLDEAHKHNFRFSVQSAFRYPSISDQWVDLNVGPFRVIGGLPEVQALYGIGDQPVYPLTGPNPITDEAYTGDGPFQIPVFRPEKVTAYEIGYRGLYFNDKLYVDAYVYRNNYNGFLASQLLAMNPGTPEEQKFMTTISSDTEVNAYGWALGAELYLPGKLTLKGNIAYNSISEENDLPPGFQTQFNSPDYRLNLGVSRRDIFPNFSANINWRWQNDFLWESSFGNGRIPAYNTLDVSFAYRLPRIKSEIKLGGSNIMNTYYTTGFGNAQVGGLYYITWQFNEFFN